MYACMHVLSNMLIGTTLKKKKTVNKIISFVDE